ncbi:Rhomboid protease GlpG [Streptomyces badius]
MDPARRLFRPEPGGEVVAAGPGVREAARAAGTWATFATAAQALGCGEALLRATVAYVKQRTQVCPSATTGIADGEWYRLVTGAFLHLPPDTSFGVMHLLFNMFALWNIGRTVEGQLGRARYLAVYLLSAVGGSVVVYLLAPDASTVGASGAVFGLAASYWIINRRLGRDMAAVNRFMAGFLLWMVLSALFTSWQGHLGGLLTGALVTYGLAYAPAKLRTWPAQLAGGAVLLGLFAVAVVVKTSALTG